MADVEKPKREYNYSALYVRAKPGLRLRDRKVSRLVHKVRTACSWLQDTDMPAIRSWCELEVLAQQAFAILRAGGIVNQQGEPRRLLDDFRKLRMAQAILTRELGMTPSSRIQIQASGTNAALDIVAAMAQPETVNRDSSDG